MVKSRIKLIMIVLMIVLIFVSTQMRSYTIDKPTTSIKEQKEESKNDLLFSLDCKCDIEKEYDDLTELCNLAEIVVEGKVVNKKSYVKVGTSIYTNYEVKTSKIYKGESLTENVNINVELLGGELTGKEYLEQVDDKDMMMEENEFSEWELNEKFVEMHVNDNPFLEIGQDYVLFGTYNNDVDIYNIVGVYQGIYEKVSKDIYVQNSVENSVGTKVDKLVEINKLDIIKNCD